ncbi:acyl-CoA Delta-9 desaturase-like [Anticarsia gemmatalis]|uniref:acyl-CoA Delta-9 desaturase-like n=1 Tax=Anticarsia gemmatalis TaxID=129554 RepID=UPI003F765AA7
MSGMKRESFFLSKARELERWFGLETEVKWGTTASVLAFHLVSFYWCYHYAIPVKWQSVVFAYAMFVFSGFGITGGAHRYWAHRAFKAATPLRLIFLFGFASAGQNTLYQWIRNHRVHHKYSDTESDPHNRERGLFFSHIGWLLMKKKKEVTSKFSEIDMSDIESDPLIIWHNKYVDIINPLVGFVLPTLVGILLWGENWRAAIAWQTCIRFLVVYHSELTVNSLGHTLGYRPYDKSMRPAENVIIAALTGGEGWHNFHHSFPFDYRAAEFYHFLDFTTNLIHLAEKFGWVTEKREVSKEMIQKYTAQHGPDSADIPPEEHNHLE